MRTSRWSGSVVIMVGMAGAATIGSLAGCSGTSASIPGGADASVAPTAAQACAATAHAVCTERSSCSQGFAIRRDYPDEMTCETRTAVPCVSALGATGTGQTPVMLESCAAAYPSEACGDFLDDNPVAACTPPAGAGATGTACGASAQCASTFCAVAEYQVCGTCQPLPAVGAPCQVADDCGRDLACATPTGATSGTCAAYVASGDMCLSGVNPCASGLACVGDDTTAMTTGTCQATEAALGAACDGSRKTAPNCEAGLGLVCIPTAKGSSIGTCQNIQLVAPAATCGDLGAAPITGFADCEAGGLCVKAATTDASGVCVAAAADGAACDSDPTKGPPCLAPAKCVPASATGTAGTCTVPDATTCM